MKFYLIFILIMIIIIFKVSIKDPKQYAAIISAKILEFLERSFPNTISVDELAR
jgi:hypothetical protein